MVKGRTGAILLAAFLWVWGAESCRAEKVAGQEVFQSGDLVEIHTPGGSKMDPDIPRILLGQLEKSHADRLTVFVFWSDEGWDTNPVFLLVWLLGSESKFVAKNPPIRETISRERILKIVPWVRTRTNPDPRPPYNFEKARLWRPEDLQSSRQAAGVSAGLRRP